MAAVKLLVAGASGFVGRRLCPGLAETGHEVIAMTRNPVGYDCSVIEGVWQAVPAVEPPAVLTAATAEELRKKVRQDYASRQTTVPMNP